MTERSTGADDLDRALEKVALQLRADGYELVAEEPSDGTVRVSVVAGPDACEECLVPKTIMAQVIATALQGFAAERIELVYPLDADGPKP